MNFIETILIFGGIPLGLALILATAVYGKTLVSGPNRYRPGRPWTYAPVWYLPHPEAGSAHGPATSSPALTAGRAGIDDDERMGGASGEW
jgi:hypothetical protein